MLFQRHVKLLINEIVCRYLLATAVLVLVFSQTACGQYMAYQPLGNKDQVTIPFQYINGHIIVNVLLDDLFEVPMILDTGSESTLLFDQLITDILGYTYDQRIAIYGADLLQERYARVCRQINLRVEGAAAGKRDIYVLEDFPSLYDYRIGKPIMGILGGDYLKNLRVRIDYRRKKLHLSKPNQQWNIKAYEEVDIDIQNDKPYVVIKTHRATIKDTLKVLIDTGSPWQLLTHQLDSLAGRTQEDIAPGRLAKGLGGLIAGYVGECDSLSIGGLTFHTVPTRYQSIDTSILNRQTVDKQGIIGNNLLSQNEVIIDYFNKKLFLLKKSSRNRKVIDHGMVIYAYGNKLDQYIVVDIVPESKAERAGIKTGDILLKVGLWKSKWYSLHQIQRKLRKNRKRALPIQVLRGHQHLNLRLDPR